MDKQRISMMQNKNTLVTVFNNYFGGGMGSIVFQTIRESKALAYSTFGYYVAPQKKNDLYIILDM
jgi:predicted Zn-dependent peptidase